jgi:putative ABC transport system permease protein
VIPLKYNVRNLRVRWITTLMTVIGTGLVVWAMVLTFGLTDGLEHALKISGHPLDLIILRKGANDETGSNIAQSTADQIADLEGVAKNDQGQPLSSAEFVTILTKPRRNNGGTTNLIIRGVDVMSRGLRPDFKIVKGRDLKPGVNEAITSENMGRRFENLALGEKLEINKVDFEIVGYFEAGGSSAESEVWTDIRDIASARRTADAISSVNLRARDAAAMKQLIERLDKDEQFSLKAVPEPTYFGEQLKQAVFIKFVGVFIAVFLTIGAMFAAANTMFAAVASRGREIGTLRALGFRRRSILLCFLLESVILCLLGGMLGCLATLPFNGLSTGTANWATFSEITFAFRFGPWVLLQGVLMSLAMGLLGGLSPAIRAVRLNIVTALREQ